MKKLTILTVLTTLLLPVIYAQQFNNKKTKGDYRAKIVEVLSELQRIRKNEVLGIDSSIFLHPWYEDEGKSEYYYNDEGYQERYLEYYRDDQNNWVESVKIDYHQTENGDMDLKEFYTWDEINSIWERSYREEFWFNDLHQLEKYLISLWNDDEWVPDAMFETSYYSNGMAEETVYWNYDGQFFEVFKANYYYDQNNLMDSTLAYDRLNNAWELSGKTEFVYESNGDLQRKTEFIRDELNVWLPVEKEERFYSDSLIKIITSGYDNNMWNSENRTDYVLSVQGAIVHKEEYHWMRSRGWESSKKWNYTYDYEVLSSEVNWPYDFWELDFDMEFSHKLMANDMYRKVDSEWRFYEDVQHYYSYLVKVPELLVEEIALFPNPADHYFEISSENTGKAVELRIYNMKGQIVLQQMVSRDERITIEGLPDGIYVYSLKEDGINLKGGKLIKQGQEGK